MKRSDQRRFLTPLLTCGLFLLTLQSSGLAQPTPAALVGFSSSVDQTEAGLNRQRLSSQTFLTGAPFSGDPQARLRRGELVVEDLTPAGGTELPGALLHHWRATAFVPRASAADFESLLRNVPAYPRYFAPQVLQAKVLRRSADRMNISMRVRQKHILTVVLDATYRVSFGRLNALDGYSTSRSTQIAEVTPPGTPSERELAPPDDHGFLWRSNTYWSWQQADGGLYLQLESISLSRSIPTGLGWAVSPFIQSVPRESIEFTLRSAIDALSK